MKVADAIAHAMYLPFTLFLNHQQVMELKAILVVGQANLAAHEVQEVPEVHKVQKEPHDRQRRLAEMDNQKTKDFVPNFCRSVVRKEKITQIFLLLIRSRVICQVSALSNCRMGTSSPHAGKGHEPFQECPSELFSFLNCAEDMW